MTTKVSILGTDPQVGVAPIADLATDSSEVDLGGKTLCGVTFDSGFNGTSLSFKVATAEGGTFVALKDSDGATVTYVVAASTYLYLDPAIFAGIRHVKFVAGSQSGITNISYHSRVV